MMRSATGTLQSRNGGVLQCMWCKHGGGRGSIPQLDGNAVPAERAVLQEEVGAVHLALDRSRLFCSQGTGFTSLTT